MKNLILKTTLLFTVILFATNCKKPIIDKPIEEILIENEWTIKSLKWETTEDCDKNEGEEEANKYTDCSEKIICKFYADSTFSFYDPCKDEITGYSEWWTEYSSDNYKYLSIFFVGVNFWLIESYNNRKIVLKTAPIDVNFITFNCHQIQYKMVLIAK